MREAMPSLGQELSWGARGGRHECHGVLKFRPFDKGLMVRAHLGAPGSSVPQ